jgi:tight adherence protein C
MDSSFISLFALIFVSVGAAVAAALWLLTDPQVAQRRLAHVAAAPLVTTQESLLNDALTPGAQRVRRYLPKSPKDMKKLERLLASAGYHGPWVAITFSLAQFGCALLLFAVFMRFLGGGGGLIFAAIFAAIGYMLPTFWLGRRIEKRKTAIRNGLPDAIDLLIVCIESGSALDQALNRVAEELALPYPALAHELELLCAETRAGKPRLEAFKNFAQRTKVDDVQSLVAMLVQTDRFGTSIGQALRTHADTSRTKRRQRAEEKAAKLGIKLLFPLIFCLFPAFYVVVLGPALIQLWRELSGAAFGVR